MKTFSLLSMLFASLANAHYAPKELTIDGNSYLARDARIDDWVGAKRIEWAFTDDQNFTWHALGDATTPAIACGANPIAPALKAIARAGANITVQWTNVPKGHWGPAMSYLGLWTPGQSPTNVSFFKIQGQGYDTTKRQWANEIVAEAGSKVFLQIPSDIVPGTYILRTELLSLHGNGQYNNPGLLGLPQFYSHCFNIEVTGGGTVTPAGVYFPGAYPKGDPGVAFILGNTAQYATYPVPGPAVYKGKYDAPAGTAPVVTPEQKGETFPAAFNTRYLAFRTKFNTWSDKAVAFFDSGIGGANFISVHQTEGNALMKERQTLRDEAIKLGLADANAKMQNSQIF